MSSPALWIALIATLLGCYFATLHVCLKRFSRSRLLEQLQQAGREAWFADFMANRSENLLATAVLRMLCTLAVLLAVLLWVEWIGFQPGQLWTYVIAFAISGVLLSVFGVSVPEFWASYSAEKFLAVSMRFIRIIELLFRPITKMLKLADPVVRRLSGYDEDEYSDSELSDEVLSVVEDRDEAGEVDESQRDMLEAVFEFKSTTVDEIMTPRTDIKGIDAASDLKGIKACIIENGFSRFPVYEETVDNIIGILYAKDLMPFIKANGEEPPAFDIRKVMREALMVPETRSVSSLLEELRAKHVHIAIVLDEYGGTAGLVTVEDIIEEIVGEIEDEYETDETPEAIRKIDDRTFEVEARLYVDDLNDEIGLEIPEDEDYDTVGGFVFAQFGHVPTVGESFEYSGTRISVIDAERTRVNRVRIQRMIGEEASDSQESQPVAGEA